MGRVWEWKLDKEQAHQATCLCGGMHAVHARSACVQTFSRMGHED